MNYQNQPIRFCTSQDGTRIAYATCGSGPALFMAGHSFSHLESEWDCLVTRPLLDWLCSKHTLVRYDMRGTGLSDRDCKEFAFARYVEDLEAVLLATKLEAFSLMGMTGGGALAVTLAAKHPEKIERLVLMGAYLRGRFARSTTPAELEETELLLKLVELGWGQDSPTFRQLFTYQFLPDGSAEQLRSFDDLMRKAASPRNAASQLRAWFSANLSEVAPQVRCPTLVLHARGDLRVPFEEGRLLAASIPGAHFVPLDSRNHFLLEQEPAWQQMVGELETFFVKVNSKTIGPVEVLTAREHAVLEVLAQGLETSVMAQRLCMSEKTVRNHLSAVYSKLGVNNRLQAVLWVEANQGALNVARQADKASQPQEKAWIAPWERGK